MKVIKGGRGKSKMNKRNNIRTKERGGGGEYGLDCNQLESVKTNSEYLSRIKNYVTFH